MTDSAARALAGKIQKLEGWFPGSLSYRQNNPGNLVYIGQAGAVMGERGKAKFASYAAGEAELVRQVKLDASRGLTVEQFIYKYAPPFENDTEKYIRDLEQEMGISRGQTLDSIGGVANDGGIFTIPIFGATATAGATGASTGDYTGNEGLDRFDPTAVVLIGGLALAAYWALEG